MIFVTVGAQMPFDRLVRSVDNWAATSGRTDIYAQIGATGWRPQHMDWAAFLDPLEYRQRFFDAEVIVAHAGIGAILTASEFGKPILVMPRRGDLNETRNDHQFGTARTFAKAGRITAAWTEDELIRSLDYLDTIPAPQRIASHASFELLRTLRQFIREDEAPVEREFAVSVDSLAATTAFAPLRGDDVESKAA